MAEEEEKISPLEAAMIGLKHYQDTQEREGAWEGQSVGSEVLDKKRREYLQVYIRGEKGSAGGSKSRRSGSKKKRTRTFWDTLGKKKRARKMVKRVYGLRKASKSKRRLSEIGKKRAKKSPSVNVKGYSYKRKGKTVRVKGHRRSR